MNLKSLFSDRKQAMSFVLFSVAFAGLAYAGGVATGISHPSLFGIGAKAAAQTDGSDTAASQYNNDTPIKAYQQYQNKGKITKKSKSKKKKPAQAADQQQADCSVPGAC